MNSESTPLDEDELEPTRVRDALSGKKAGEYLLGARLGQGAMGVVYKGTHPLLGRQAAVKVLNSESPDAGQKLLAEARAVAQARHPNIIDIFGFGTTEDGQPYFVMELLEGDPLDLWLRNRPPLTPVEAVAILKQLFSGLAAAHTANVIHRDLKPTNLFMARLADGTHFLKILDFGLSKQFDPDSPEKTMGNMVGTPLYMAPEQTVGQPSTPATDLYAAGCIAYELLTGHPPFRAPSVLDLLRQQRDTTAPPLPERSLDGVTPIPPLLRELVAALLQKSPAKRPASAAEARQALDRVERKIIAASAPSGLLPPPRPAAVRPSSEQATVPLPRLPPFQERETIKMDPIQMELPPRVAPRPVPVVSVAPRTATKTELQAPAPARSNTLLIIALVLGVVVVGGLLWFLFK